MKWDSMIARSTATALAWNVWTADPYRVLSETALIPDLEPELGLLEAHFLML